MVPGRSAVIDAAVAPAGSPGLSAPLIVAGFSAVSALHQRPAPKWGASTLRRGIRYAEDLH
jgi:hypothetical protein